MVDFVKIKDFFQKLELEIPIEELPPIQGSLSDVQLRLDNETIHADLRKEIRPQHVALFRAKMEKDAPFLVVSNYITPNAKGMLREYGVNYIDGFGNAFINLKQLRVHFENNNTTPVYGSKTNKAFTKSGGQVIFQLLKDNNAIALNHRELATLSQVSLGTVSNVINGLLDARFLVRTDRASKYQMVNKQELLSKWVTLFNEKILSANHIGTFKTTKKNADYRVINVDEKVLWSGEPAASELTNFLNPEKWSLFTMKSKADIIKDLRLVPDESGQIEIYKPFWGSKEVKALKSFNSNHRIVDPLLIYAELIYSANGRNREIAQKIYDEYIKAKL